MELSVAETLHYKGTLGMYDFYSYSVHSIFCSSCLDDGTVLHCPTWNTEHRTSRHKVSDGMGPPGIVVALVYKVLPGTKLKQSHVNVILRDPSFQTKKCTPDSQWYPYSDI